MRVSNAMAPLLVVALLVLMAAPSLAQEPGHGGSLTNTRNHLYIVDSDAQNPQGIDAGYGGLFVKELVSFTNDDPAKVPDYGIVYVDPTFEPDPNTPIVVAYTHEYTIANYTLQLINMTDGWVGNITGHTTTSATLRPGPDLGPEGPEKPHPKVNATYIWQVLAVSTQNRTIVSEYGGEVTTEVFNDTLLDWSGLDLPGIGPHTYEADKSDLAQLTLMSIMEVHPSLSAGWYRFRIQDQMFEYGVSLTIEIRYTGTMDGGRVVMDKFVFTPRTIDLDVYHRSRIEVLMFDDIDGKGSQISPTRSSSVPGEPTEFTYTGTFSLVVQEPDAEGTDWGLYGRYALLAILVGVLLLLVLWSGRDKRAGEEEEGPGDEDPEVVELRAQLEGRRAAIMAEIKDLDRRHEEGEIGEGVWKRKRKSLKNRAVEIMRELDDLGTGGGAAIGGPDENGDEVSSDLRSMRELDREKERLLQRIRDLDGRHDDGELEDDDWKRQRKALKAEVVEIIRDMEELEEE